MGEGAILRRAGLVLASLLAIVAIAGPAQASAASPPPGPYYCQFYIDGSYPFEVGLTIKSATKYKWSSPKGALTNLPHGSGSGKYKMSGTKLKFTSGPLWGPKQKPGQAQSTTSGRYKGKLNHVPAGDFPAYDYIDLIGVSQSKGEGAQCVSKPYFDDPPPDPTPEPEPEPEPEPLGTI